MGCIKRRYSCRQTREMQFRSANCPRYGAKTQGGVRADKESFRRWLTDTIFLITYKAT